MLDLIVQYLDTHSPINFPSLMFQHLSHCIDRKFVVGYSALIKKILLKAQMKLHRKSPKGQNTKQFKHYVVNGVLVKGNYVIGEDDDESIVPWLGNTLMGDIEGEVLLKK